MKLIEDQTDIDDVLKAIDSKLDRFGRLFAQYAVDVDEETEPARSIRQAGSEIATALRELAAVQRQGLADVASAIRERQ
jgi:hypothetical protein